MPGVKDRLTDAGYGLGWLVVCRLPESWARQGFRFAADLAWRLFERDKIEECSGAGKNEAGAG